MVMGLDRNDIFTLSDYHRTIIMGCSGEKPLYNIGWSMGSRIIHYMTYWWNGWEWGNGMIITSDYGSFPHSLLSTSKMIIHKIFAQPGC